MLWGHGSWFQRRPCGAFRAWGRACVGSGCQDGRHPAPSVRLSDLPAEPLRLAVSGKRLWRRGWTSAASWQSRLAASTSYQTSTSRDPPGQSTRSEHAELTVPGSEIDGAVEGRIPLAVRGQEHVHGRSRAPERAKGPANRAFLRGRDRRRSGDLALFRRALYRLSYPTADLTGFEPATSGLTGRRALLAAPQVLVAPATFRAARGGRSQLLGASTLAARPSFATTADWRGALRRRPYGQGAEKERRRHGGRCQNGGCPTNGVHPCPGDA